MLVNKITVGFVIQVYDTDSKRFVSQQFVAGDTCEYEDQDGVPVSSEALKFDGTEAYLPFDMIQPATPESEEIVSEECAFCGKPFAGTRSGRLTN